MGGRSTATVFVLAFWIAMGVTAADGEKAVRVTMYDDGVACPMNCDAHVVFHGSMNGTRYAHLPGTGPTKYQKCITNKDCEICFDASSSQCIVVVYRGPGPTRNTFDFTPAFLEKHCGESNLPEALAGECLSLREAADALASRVNCLQRPSLAPCRPLIEAAAKLKAEDQPKYQACVQEGEAQFNKHELRVTQRSNRCAYERYRTGGPNSKGTRWKRLLPAACREGTFVGRDGLDCCTGSLLYDGKLGEECQAFYLDVAAQ